MEVRLQNHDSCNWLAELGCLDKRVSNVDPSN
jgi:hypothetical protein